MQNSLITIPEKNIFLEFVLNDKMYVVFSKSSKLEEGDEVYFAKVDVLDGQKIARNIETDEEYEEVEKEYERILTEYVEDGEDAEL